MQTTNTKELNKRRFSVIQNDDMAMGIVNNQLGGYDMPEAEDNLESYPILADSHNPGVMYEVRSPTSEQLENENGYIPSKKLI